MPPRKNKTSCRNRTANISISGNEENIPLNNKVKLNLSKPLDRIDCSSKSPFQDKMENKNDPKAMNKKKNESVLDVSYMNEATGSELAKRLKDVSEELQKIPNQHQVELLRPLSKSLIGEKVIESKDKMVRLVGACCMVDVFRIFAPDAPYSDYELSEIFKLIISQLNCLGQQSNGDSLYYRYFYLLESLATVKSCILIVGLDGQIDNGDDEAEESLLVQLFSCFFSSIREDHSIKVESHMLTIMQSCIEEIENIHWQLLDCILENLIPNKTSSTNVAAHRLAQQLILKTKDFMQPHLSQFFNNILIDGRSSQSELSDQVNNLIYEVHKINPSLLLYVLPNVCMQLQVDDLKTRQEAIALMGRLFASSHADYGVQYIKNFREFLGRFKDKEKEIRMQMIQVGTIILHRKPDLGEPIRNELRNRLADPEWEVRRRAVNEICDVAVTNLDVMDKMTLQEVGERMKDKKVILRKEAMTGLAQIYAEHIPSTWSTVADISQEAKEKLTWIPDYVLKCYAYPLQEIRLRVIQLLSDIILPKKLSEEARMYGFLDIFKSLDNTSREAFRRYLMEVKHAQSIISQYLALRQNERESNSNSSSDLLAQLVIKIADLLPDVDNRHKLVDQLHGWRDLKLFKNLEIITSCFSSSVEIRSARDDLVKSVGSKTPLGEFMKSLCRKISMSVISSDSISELLKIAQNEMAQKKIHIYETVVEALLIVSEIFPSLFLYSIDTLLDLHSPDGDSISEKLLALLSNICPLLKEKKFVHRKDLNQMFRSKCSKGSVEEAKNASECFASLYDNKDISDLIIKLSKDSSLNDENSHIATVLMSLSILFKRSPEAMSDKCRIDVLSKLYGEFLSTAKSPKGCKKLKKGASSSHIRQLAVKLLVNLLLKSIGSEVNGFSPEEEGKKAIELLFQVLESSGKIWGSQATDASIHRISASNGLLKLARVPIYENLYTVRNWHVLGYTIQDSNTNVRENMIVKLKQGILKHNLQQKYMSYIVLTATDPDTNIRKQAKSFLQLGIKKMRQIHEAKSSSLDFSDSMSRVLMVPEYTLPYVIHLLAHHPECPSEKSAQWSSQLQYLHFLIDCLVSHVNYEADNIAFLLQILEMMQKCHDSYSSTSENTIHALINSATRILKSKIKTQHNLKPYPGKIFLPKQLYQITKETIMPSPFQITPKRKEKQLELSPISTSTYVESDNTIGSNTASAKRRSSYPPSFVDTISSKKKQRNRLSSTTPIRRNPGRRAKFSKSFEDTPNTSDLPMSEASKTTRTSTPASEKSDMDESMQKSFPIDSSDDEEMSSFRPKRRSRRGR